MNKPKINIGADMEEICRFRHKPFEKNVSFYNSIFDKSELTYCLKYSDPYPHIAGIFAAKEAVIKCANRPLRMTDIEVQRNSDGRPIAIVHHKKQTIEVQISISHTKSLALAVAIVTL